LMEQVLINLVLNARDAILAHSGAYTGVIRVEATEVSRTATHDEFGVDLPAGRYVELRVVDNGPGMSADVRERAFDPFFTTKEIGSGSGLGLSSTYGVITSFGGAVSLTGAEPQGLAVVMLLPVADAPAVTE
jgi:two-component system, cell cycle sensor histidine kinase and response regulator CckA